MSTHRSRLFLSSLALAASAGLGACIIVVDGDGDWDGTHSYHSRSASIQRTTETREVAEYHAVGALRCRRIW